MLKLRTIILSGMVAAILVLTVQMATARTDSTSELKSGAENVTESQEVSTVSKKTYDIPEYRAQFGECSDVSIAELSACRTESQPSAEVLLDECFDVSLMEVASCRAADQSSAP